jgi:hypothetical protein
MDRLVDLGMDRHFREFNLCAFHDPTLSPGGSLSEAALFRRAFEIRKGDAGTAGEFAEAFQRTLRKETFEAFQKQHGPRPITYADWFYAKFDQFLSILLYEKLLVVGLGEHGGLGPPRTDMPWKEGTGQLTGEKAIVPVELLEQAFPPESLDEIDWSEFVESELANQLESACRGGLKVLERLLRRTAARRQAEPQRARQNLPRTTARKPTAPRKKRPATLIRDNLICSLLEQGVLRPEICKRMDQAGIPTTPAMKKLDVNLWEVAWNDLEIRPNVQTIITKARNP